MQPSSVEYIHSSRSIYKRAIFLIGAYLAISIRSAYSICNSCSNAAMAQSNFTDAATFTATASQELADIATALNDELDSEEPDFDLVENYWLQATELNASLQQAEQLQAQYGGQMVPNCQSDPPCGQGVPQDPVYPEDPPGTEPPASNECAPYMYV
jgi:hypothetical protein